MAARKGLGAVATSTHKRSKRELSTHWAEPAAAVLMHLGMYPHPGARSGSGVAVGEGALEGVGVSAGGQPGPRTDTPLPAPGLALQKWSACRSQPKRYFGKLISPIET